MSKVRLLIGRTVAILLNGQKIYDESNQEVGTITIQGLLVDYDGEYYYLNTISDDDGDFDLLVNKQHMSSLAIVDENEDQLNNEGPGEKDLMN